MKFHPYCLMGVHAVFILTVLNEKHCVSTESNNICMRLRTCSRDVNKGEDDDTPGGKFVREKWSEKTAEESRTVIANG